MKAVWAVVIMMACVTGGARAQAQGDFAGAWSFQTTNYGTGGQSAVLSGRAEIVPAGQDTYAIDIRARETVTEPGESPHTEDAVERCVGKVRQGNLTIACIVTSPTDGGYAPDDFILHFAGNGALTGLYESNGQATATFTRSR